MNEAVKQGFKDACAKCLDAYALMSLRSYAREIGVDKPTKKQKGELIAEIVSVLAGEKEPVQRTTRGAPVKDDFVDPQITAAINKLQFIYEPADTLAECEERKSRLNATWEDRKREFSAAMSFGVQDSVQSKEKIYAGQLKTHDGLACLLPLSFELSKGKIIVSVEQIRRYDLREGDMVDCRIMVKNSVIYAADIIAVNGVEAGALSRVKYDEATVCLPENKICFFSERSAEGKYLDWLMPIGKGQRSLVVGAPKTGKTRFILNAVKELKKTSPDLELLIVLIEQSPEILCEFQRFIDKNHLVATTYMDSANKHVLAAEFLLARAKRLAECGKDVLLVVDGVNALAKAYDETDVNEGKTLPCGLSAATLHYVKKYFASAKCLEKKGSLTIMAAVAEKTGVPADEAIVAELAGVANQTTALETALALRRLYPAVDFVRSHSDYANSLLTEREKATEMLYRNRLHYRVSADFLPGVLTMAKNYQEFEKFIQDSISKIQ